MTIFKLSKLIRVKILKNNQNHLIYFFIWKQASIALMINHLLIFSFICWKQLSHLAHIIATINMGRSFLPSPTPHPPRPNYTIDRSLSLSLLSLTHTNTLQCVFFSDQERELKNIMELVVYHVLMCILVVFVYLLLRVACETIWCYWLTPRRIRKTMEKQGVRGPKPRFLVGNIHDMASLVAKSTSHDMDSINHDIVGRLLPQFVCWSKTYGNY